MRKSLLLIIVTLIIFGIACAGYKQCDQPKTLTIVKPDTLSVIDTVPIIDTIPDTIPKKKLSFKDSLYLAMDEYGIHHKDIVYAQAVLETGHFKSKLCKKGNLFGLKGKKGYRHFKHWKESVKMYKEKIQNRYKHGEDYYHFLKRIHYASSPTYNQKVKQIVKRLKK